MNQSETPQNFRVLSLVFASTRLGYIVMESQDFILDHGVKTIPGSRKLLAFNAIKSLLDAYQPDLILIQNTDDRFCKLGSRIRFILLALTVKIPSLGYKVKSVNKPDVWQSLELPERTNKHTIVRSVAQKYPSLSKLVPPRKRLWESEHRNTLILIAASQVATLSQP